MIDPEDVEEIQSTLYERLAQRVRAKRTQLEMSQPRLAEVAGLGEGTIQALEKSRRLAKLDVLVRLSAVFQMPVHLFFVPEDQWRKSPHYAEGKQRSNSRVLSRPDYDK